MRVFPASPSFVMRDRVLSCGMRPYIIAEIGINHNGDLDLARRSIDAAAACGADAVKFQTFRADEFMSEKDLVFQWDTKEGTESESMYELFRRVEMREEWHEILQDHARGQQVDFMSSTADAAAYNLLCDLDVPAIKLASEDLINRSLLKVVAGRPWPLILSTGMADIEEISEALEILEAGGGFRRDSIMLMHCVSLYPTRPDCANMARIQSLASAFGCAIGYSDHTEGNDAAVLATGLGALAIEKHFTLDRSMPGPDHALSSDPEAFADMVQRVETAAAMMGNGRLTPEGEEATVRRTYRRSIVANCTLEEGTLLQEEHLALKRPGTGIHPRHLPDITGRRLCRSVAADQQMRWDDLIPMPEHPDENGQMTDTRSKAE